MEINSQNILYNKVGGDESYTPEYGVRPMIKYIKDYIRRNKIKHLNIWCPFDKRQESNFVKVLSEIESTNIISTHIDEGQDFFNYEPPIWDIIISNPPFKNKRQFFERALSFDKPFALLMTNTWLNDKYSKWVFKEANKDMQLLMFDKRIHFEQNGEIKKKTTFSSSYYCYNFLPKQIILEELYYE
jgi:hypothetical protein